MVTSVVNAKVGGRARFLPTAVVLGVISIAGSTWLALLDQFTSFLSIIGAFFVPVFAIMIVDYYYVKRAAYTRDLLAAHGGRYWYSGGVNWPAVGVWIFGAGASYLLTFLWPSPIGATLPVFAGSAILYSAIMMGERGRYAGAPGEHLAEPDDRAETGVARDTSTVDQD